MYRFPISFVLLCLFSSTSWSVTEIGISPGIVFENSDFRVNLSISPACSDGVTSLTSERVDNVISYEAIADGNFDVCKDISPVPLAGVANYYSNVIEGLPRGTYTINLKVVSMETGVKTTVLEVTKSLNVYSQEDFKGSGKLAYSQESPASGDSLSGIGLIRGWACFESPLTVGTLQYSIDDKDLISIPYGSLRADTAEVCNGNQHTGYGAVVNWGSFKKGEHTFKLYINGTLVETNKFNTTGTGVEFIRGLTREFTLENFPESGKVSSVAWSEALQNFVITDTSDMP